MTPLKPLPFQNNYVSGRENKNHTTKRNIWLHTLKYTNHFKIKQALHEIKQNKLNQFNFKSERKSHVNQEGMTSPYTGQLFNQEDSTSLYTGQLFNQEDSTSVYTRQLFNQEGLILLSISNDWLKSAIDWLKGAVYWQSWLSEILGHTLVFVPFWSPTQLLYWLWIVMTTNYLD